MCWNHSKVSVSPMEVAERANMRFGSVGPGSDAKNRSMTANSWARVVITGTFSGGNLEKHGERVSRNAECVGLYKLFDSIGTSV